MEGKEAKPRSNKPSYTLALELEARPSNSFGLAHGPMAILMGSMWKAGKPSQEPTQPLTIPVGIWKPDLPHLEA